MKHSSIVYTMSTALVALVLTVATGLANGSVSIDGQSNITIGLYEAHEFDVHVTNEGFSDMKIYVVRTVNNLPDDEWFTTVCMGDLCYAPSVSTTNPVTVRQGEVYKVRFTVYSGEVPASGTFQLKVFMMSGAEESELGSVDFSVTSSDDSSVPTTTITEARSYPSPATDFVTIAGLQSESPQQIEVLDAAGRSIMVVNTPVISPEGVVLDVTDLPAGSYFFRTIDSGEVETGRFIVAR